MFLLKATSVVVKRKQAVWKSMRKRHLLSDRLPQETVSRCSILAFMQHFPTEYNIINYRPPLETQPEFSQ